MSVLVKALIETGLINKFNFTRTRVINGKKVKIPVINAMGLGNVFMNDVWMTDVYKNLTGTFVDVGVNVGQTLIKLRSVSDAPYVGFEPNPACLYYVNQLIKVNDYKNVTIYPVAVSDKIELRELNIYDGGAADPSASMIKDFRPGAVSTQIIPCFSSASLELYDKVSCIKIDVEGAELEVLKSLQPIIKRDQPVILLEVLPPRNADRISRQMQIEELMFDYDIFRIGEGSVKQVSEFGYHDNMDWCDYMLKPKASTDQSIQSMESRGQVKEQLATGS